MKEVTEKEFNERLREIAREHQHNTSDQDAADIEAEIRRREREIQEITVQVDELERRLDYLKGVKS